MDWGIVTMAHLQMSHTQWTGPAGPETGTGVTGVEVARMKSGRDEDS